MLPPTHRDLEAAAVRLRRVVRDGVRLFLELLEERGLRLEEVAALAPPLDRPLLLLESDPASASMLAFQTRSKSIDKFRKLF